MQEDKNKTGVLLIHGFTSHKSSLEAVIPELKKRGIPWHYPILTGHGTTPNDLRGITWQHWQADVQNGLDYLLQTSNQVTVIALSMGALLALELAVANPKTIRGLILLSPTLYFKPLISRHAPLVTKLSKVFPVLNSQKYSSITASRVDKGYRWFPTKTFMHYWLRTQHFDSVLEKVNQPTTIIHSKKDRLADPVGAEHIYQTIKSKDKEIIWLNKSGHELLLDVETDDVVKIIINNTSLLNS